MLSIKRGIRAVAIAALALLSWPVGPQTRIDDNRPWVHLTVSDFGIGQWNSKMVPLQSFTNNVGRYAVPGLNPSGQMLLPMGRDSDLPKTLADRKGYVETMARAIAEHIDTNYGKTGGNYELQLAQHINKLGYMSGRRQAMCADFAKDAYEIVGRVEELLQDKYRFTANALVGSNGAHVMAESLPLLAKNPFDTVIMVSGRAYTKDFVALYKTMDGHAAIVNETRDVWSTGRMIANHGTSEELQKVCPLLGVYKVDTGRILPLAGHIDTMFPNGKPVSVDVCVNGKHMKLTATSNWDLMCQIVKRENAKPSLANSDLGGVDLSDLNLSFVSTKMKKGEALVGPLFSAEYLGGKADSVEMKRATRLARDAFLIGLAVPADKFWVNLNPTEPDRIADPTLSRTDVARVLLEADLQMKKDAAAITDPRKSGIGREYWARLTAAAGSGRGPMRVTQQTRFWIVPGTIEVAGDNDELYLVRADLEVRLESEYFSAFGAKNNRGREAGERVAMELVLPELTDVVNHEPEYADLRKVFQGLIMATWYRQRHAGRFDSGDLTGLESREQWSPGEIWTRYVDSVQKGEYNFSETHRESRGSVTTTQITHYFSGGVDFRNIDLPPTQPLDSDTHLLFSKAFATPQGVLRGQTVWFADAASFCTSGGPIPVKQSRSKPRTQNEPASGRKGGPNEAAASLGAMILLATGGVWLWLRNRR